MNKYMKMAIDEAYYGFRHKHGGPFGAVIVKNNQVVGKGHNMVLKNQDPTCHAEIEAIRNACKKLKTYDLSGCDIYIVGDPCPMCFAAINWANINKIYYGCNTSDADEIGFRDKIFFDQAKELHKRAIQINRKECYKLYKDYFKTKHQLY